MWTYCTGYRVSCTPTHSACVTNAVRGSAARLTCPNQWPKYRLGHQSMFELALAISLRIKVPNPSKAQTWEPTPGRNYRLSLPKYEFNGGLSGEGKPLSLLSFKVSGNFSSRRGHSLIMGHKLLVLSSSTITIVCPHVNLLDSDTDSFLEAGLLKRRNAVGSWLPSDPRVKTDSNRKQRRVVSHYENGIKL